MLETHLRQAATTLLESAIRIAPRETREWGQAILGELSYVEGPWTAMTWALGGASFLVKDALLSLVMPGRPGFAPEDELFAKSVSLRRAALVAGAGCALAALLFFAAPPFRQAFRVALRPWYSLLRTASGNIQPDFEALARRAEAQHDPEGLAFCAVRLQNSRESVRLAQEAVRLDPNLLWVYAVVSLRHPEVDEIGQWVRQLERWDPQNALLHLIRAKSIEHARRGVLTPATLEQDLDWRRAMAAAFHSPRFDDYLDRVAELNRRVVPRYRFYDPYEVQSREELDLPVSAFENSQRFAKSLLRSGQDLEARGDWKSARNNYWRVACFGQVIDSQGRTGFEHWTGTTLQAIAYKQLQASFEKGGDHPQATLFGYLAAKFDPAGGKQASSPGQSTFGLYTSRRNAAVLQISGLMLLVFSGLVVVAASILIIEGRRGALAAAQRAKPVATLVVLTSAAGLLFSSITLYVTYRPYWYIFQGAILSGGRSHARDLRDFLMATQMLSGVPPRVYLLLDALLYSGSPSFLFYFWTGVTLLGVIGLVLILLRQFLGHPRANGIQHIPRAP
jgi:hypothetical protein